MSKHVIIAITLCMPFSVGAADIAINQKMTEDELSFYFGETSYDKIGSMYDVGLLKKVKKPDNLLTRVLGTSDPREEYEFKAFGMDVSMIPVQPLSSLLMSWAHYNEPFL